MNRSSFIKLGMEPFSGGTFGLSDLAKALDETKRTG